MNDEENEQNKDDPFCPHCGNHMESTDEFCSKCGAHAAKITGERSTPQQVPEHMPLTDHGYQSQPRWPGIVGGILLVFIGMLFFIAGAAVNNGVTVLWGIAMFVVGIFLLIGSARSTGAPQR